MTLDTEPMKLVIIDMNVRWYQLVPSALHYYEENEHPRKKSFKLIFEL
jgi:hypothetical protein